MTKLIIHLFSIIVLASCATHYGSISSDIPEGNYIYQDVAHGISQTSNFLGIGGTSKDGLILEAKNDMMKNRPLSAGESYINYTLDIKETIYPFYSTKKVTLSADVIKFSGENSERYSDNYRNKVFGKEIKNELFSVGDTVIYNKHAKGRIIAFETNEKVRIQVSGENFKTKRLSVNDIFTTKKDFHEFSVGDHYNFMHGEEQIDGKIIALGLKKLIIKTTTDDIIRILNYK